MIVANQISDSVHFSIQDEDQHIVYTDASEVAGGKNAGFRPMQLLLAAIASCSAIDIVLILKKQRFTQIELEIRVEGIRKSGNPAPFTQIDLWFKAHSSIPKDKLERAIELGVHTYCSVKSSLDPEIVVNTHID